MNALLKEFQQEFGHLPQQAIDVLPAPLVAYLVNLALAKKRWREAPSSRRLSAQNPQTRSDNKWAQLASLMLLNPDAVQLTETAISMKSNDGGTTNTIEFPAGLYSTSTQAQQSAEDVCADKVCAVLQLHGWVPTDGVAIASKTFPTAVGPKVALVYLQDYGKGTENYVLAGDYQSEGRNILEPEFVLLPKQASDEVLRSLVLKFAAKVAKAIAASYAARLLYLRFKPGEFGSGPNGLPAITWWRHGVATAGEPSTVTEVREYASDAERMLAWESCEQ